MIIVDVFLKLQEIYDKLCLIPVFYYPCHFITAAVVSYFASNLFLIKREGNILEQLLEIKQFKQANKNTIRHYTFLYSIVTAFGSVAILYNYSPQKLNFISAIIWGLAGPYAFRHDIINRIQKGLPDNLVKNTNEQLEKRIHEDDKQINKEIQDYISKSPKL